MDQYGYIMILPSSTASATL